MRAEGFLNEDLVAHEDDCYLAVQRLDQSPKANQKDQSKNDQESYVYLTKNRGEAAVWSWQEVAIRLDTFRAECPLSRLTLFITNFNWLHTNRKQEFTFENVDSFQQISFFNDNTFEYQITGEQRYEFHKVALSLRRLKAGQFAKATGTWRISYNYQNSEMTEFVLAFNDEFGLGTVKFRFQGCHSLLCVNSNSARFETGHELVK